MQNKFLINDKEDEFLYRKTMILMLMHNLLCIRKKREFFCTRKCNESKDVIRKRKVGKVYNVSARKPMVFRPWDEWRYV